LALVRSCAELGAGYGSGVTKLTEIEAAAMSLPEKDRLQLAGKLLSTVPPPSPLEPEGFLAEAERREAELNSGQVKSLSEDEFWAGVRRAQR